MMIGRCCGMSVVMLMAVFLLQSSQVAFGQARSPNGNSFSDLTVREVAVKYFFEKHHAQAVFFLSFAKDVDPDDEFISRFANTQATVRKGSQGILTKEGIPEGNFKIRDKATGEPGVALILGPVSWRGPIEARVELTYSASLMGVGQFFYTVECPDGKCNVTKEESGVQL